MSFPTPWSLIGKIIKWGWDKLTRFWLLKTYKRSHEFKQKRLRLGARWEKLGEHLEYSLRLSNPADHGKIKSRVAFRSPNGLIKKANMFFEARGSGIRYQQRIELTNVNENVLIVTLDQIPQDDLLESSERGFFFTIEEIQFLECQVILSNGHHSTVFDSITSHLTYNWLLNDKWKRRWGILWNCNAIEYAKVEISHYWRWRLGDYRHFVFSSHDEKGIAIKGRIYKRLCRILIHPYALTIQFWLAIHSGCYSLGDGKLIRKRKFFKAQ